MGINYLEGINSGGLMDVSAWSRPDRYKKVERELELADYLPDLKNFLAKEATEINQDFVDFLDSEARVEIAGSEAEHHKYLVSVQERTFSKKEGKSLKAWRRDTEKDPANLTEMALTVMLHKFLKEHFIVARASKFDDYNNGVDQVLIYKSTGEVVCGIDEVIINPNDKDGGTKKVAKLENIMTKGGARLQYGAELRDGKLERAEVKNIPAFFMSLTKAELGELLKSIKNNPTKTSALEEKIFAQLLDSLEAQTRDLNLSKNLQTKTQSALEKLRACLKVEKIAA